MTPRVKYDAPRMAPEFTPTSQRHVQPLLRPVARAVVRVDSGYLPTLTADWPSRTRPALPEPLPTEEEHTTSLAPRCCLDCQVEFQPRAWNHTRCAGCTVLRRKQEGAARKTTSRTRASTPRACQIAATRAINLATRERARISETARRRSA